MAAAPQVSPPLSQGSGVNWKPTVILLALVMALALWVWQGEQELKPVDPVMGQAKKLLPHLHAHDVVGLTVEIPDTLKVVLTRPEPSEDETAGEGVMGLGGWTITSPLTDDADDANLAKLINGLEYATWIEEVAPDQAGSVPFGETQLNLVIERKDGKDPFKLSFGEAQPSGVSAVRVEGRDDLYLVQSAIPEGFPEDLWVYRRKVLFNAPRPDVNKLEITRQSLSQSPGSEEETIALVYQDRFWRLGTDGDYADKGLVSELLDHTLGIRAVASESDAPSDEDLARCGLTKPWARLAVGLPDELAGAKDDLPRQQEVILGGTVPEHEGQRYARFGSRPYVYRVEVKALEAELSLRPTEEFHTKVLLPMRGTADTISGYGAKFAGGMEWRIQKREEGWVFEGPGDVRASPNPALELARSLASLETQRLLGHRDDTDLAAKGLDTPQLQIELVEAPLRREIHVGNRVSGEPGHFYVLRLGDGRVFVADLGLLPQRLKAAPLELLDRRIFRASSFDSQRILITGPGDEVQLDVSRIPTQEGVLEHWKVNAPESLQAAADTDLIQRFADLFDQVNVDRYLAHDSEEARAKYGLDAPTQVQITVQVYGEGEEISNEDRSLLIGARDGQYVYALNTDQGVIGRIDAGFLDRLERGFAKGTTVMTVDRWSIGEIVLEENGAEVMRLTRHNQNWKRDVNWLTEKEDVEALLEAFEEIQLTRTDRATTQRKEKHGLASPRMRISFTTLPVADQKAVKHVLMIGAPFEENAFEVWATTETDGKPHESLGTLFNRPLQELESYRKRHPTPSPFPPVDPGGS